MMKSAPCRQAIEDQTSRIDSTTTCQSSHQVKRRASARLSNSRLHDVMTRIRGDENLRYLTARVENYEQLTEARIAALGRAISAGEGNTVAVIAHALSDGAARIGAINLMKLGISMQISGRNQQLDKAKTIFFQLEKAYQDFKQNLISEW